MAKRDRDAGLESLSIDNLMAMVDENREQARGLERQWEENKERRQVLLHELSCRGLRVAADFYAEDKP